MKWSPGDRRSIEDRRGASGLRGVVPLGIGGVVVLLVLSWATGTDFLSLLGGDGGGAPSTIGQSAGEASPQEERMVDFVGAVANDTQKTWAGLLGPRYEQT